MQRSKLFTIITIIAILFPIKLMSFGGKTHSGITYEATRQEIHDVKISTMKTFYEDDLLNVEYMGSWLYPQNKTKLYLSQDVYNDVFPNPYNNTFCWINTLSSGDAYQPVIIDENIPPWMQPCSVQRDEAPYREHREGESWWNTPRAWIYTGSVVEDHPLSRAKHHFHDPTKDWFKNAPQRDAGLYNYPYSYIWTLVADRFTLALSSEHFFLYGKSSLARSLFFDSTLAIFPDNKLNLWESKKYLYISLTGDCDFDGKPDSCSSKQKRESYMALHFLALGMNIHLLEDAGVPAHVRNDWVIGHMTPFTTGYPSAPPEARPPNPFGEPFEGYREGFAWYNQFSGYEENEKLLINIDKYSDLWDSTTEGSYNSAKPGLAEWTNHNFISYGAKFKDLNWNRYISWENNELTQYDNPSPPNDAECTMVRIDDDYYKEYCSFSYHDHFSEEIVTMQKYVVKSQMRPLFGASDEMVVTYTMDDACYKDHSMVIMPRIVTYIKSFLRYYYRAELGAKITDVEQDDEEDPESDLLVEMSVKFDTNFGNRMDDMLKQGAISFTLVDLGNEAMIKAIEIEEVIADDGEPVWEREGLLNHYTARLIKPKNPGSSLGKFRLRVSGHSQFEQAAINVVIRGILGNEGGDQTYEITNWRAFGRDNPLLNNDEDDFEKSFTVMAKTVPVLFAKITEYSIHCDGSIYAEYKYYGDWYAMGFNLKTDTPDQIGWRESEGGVVTEEAILQVDEDDEKYVVGAAYIDGEEVAFSTFDHKGVRRFTCPESREGCPSVLWECNIESDTSSFCERTRSQENCGRPGEPRAPDDNLIVSDLYDIGVPTYDPEAKVGIMISGYYTHAISLMGKLGVPVTLIEPDLDFYSGLALDVPVLIVPSAGFTNYRDSESFKQDLEEYVNGGGALIVFTQESGTEFNLLPGDIVAYGYSEDTSCFWGGAKLNLPHPILSSENGQYAGAHLDGFFVNYPADAEELLIRKSNGQPAVIVYPYGEGTVIATDMYPDYSYATGQYSKNELRYTRDMITWALKPSELREYSPGGMDPDFDFTLELPADAPADAAAAHVTVLDPDRSEALVEDYPPVYIEPGDTAMVSLSLPELPEKLGIWHVAYELVDADGDVIHEERECLDGRFVVSDWKIIQPVPGLHYYLTQDDDGHELGEIIHFQLTFTNDTDEDIIIPNVKWDINHTPSWTGVDWASDVLAPAHGSVTITMEKDSSLIPKNYRFWAHIKLPNGTLTTTSIWGKVLTDRSVKPVGLSAERENYHASETVLVEALLSNDGELGDTAEVSFTVTRPDGEVIFTETRVVDIFVGGVRTESYYIPLDSQAPTGYYKALVKTFINGVEKGSRSTRFVVDIYRVSIEVQPPGPIMIGVPYDFVIKVINVSRLDIPGGTVTYERFDANGDPVDVVTSSFSLLPVGETHDVVVSANVPQVPITTVDARDYHCKQTIDLSRMEGISPPLSSTRLSGTHNLRFTADVTDGAAIKDWTLRSDFFAAIQYPNDASRGIHYKQEVLINDDFAYASYFGVSGDFIQTINATSSLGGPFGDDQDYVLSLTPGEETDYAFSCHAVLPEYAPADFDVELVAALEGDTSFAGVMRSGEIKPIKGSMEIIEMEDEYRERDPLSFSIDYKALYFSEQLSPTLVVEAQGVDPGDYVGSETVTIYSGTTYTEGPYEFTVRGGIDPGEYTILAGLVFPNGQNVPLHGASRHFYIPPSDITTSLEVSEYWPGDEVQVTFENVGGVGTSFGVRAVLEDSSGNVIIDHRPFGGDLAHGETITATIATVPTGLSSGVYQLRVYTFDYRSYEDKSLLEYITVHGVEADLDVWTNKEIYSANEPITGDGLLTSGGVGLDGEALNLQILRYSYVDLPNDKWPTFRHDAGNTGSSSLGSKMTYSSDVEFAWRHDLGADMLELYSSPVIEDLDGDGKNEVIVAAGYNDPGFGLPFSDIGSLIVFNGNGDGGDSMVLSIGAIWASYSTPAVADINGDSYKDIVVGSASPAFSGFYIFDGPIPSGELTPRFIGFEDESVVMSSPALYNLDGDTEGTLEIILQSGGQPYGEYETGYPSHWTSPYYTGQGPMVFDHEGNRLWVGVDPYLGPLLDGDSSVGGSSSPAVGDIDGDGLPEIVVGWDLQTVYGGATIWTGGVHAFNHDGGFLWSYYPDLRVDPADPEIYSHGPVTNAPVIADLDGDGAPEVIFQQSSFYGYGVTIDAGIIVLNGANGSVKWTSATNLSGFTNSMYGMAPAVGDADGDGDLEVFAMVEDDDWGILLLKFDALGNPIWSPDDAPHIDYLWNPWYLVNSAPTLIDIDDDGYLEVVFQDNTGGWTLFVIDGVTGAFQWQLDQYGASDVVFGDLNNDGRAEMIAAENYLGDAYLNVYTGPPGAIVDDVGMVEEVFWSETTFPVAASGDTLNLDREIYPDELYPTGETGSFFWRGTISNAFGQIVAQELYPFQISGVTLVAKIGSDKFLYKTNEPFSLEGSVLNSDTIAMDGLVYKWLVLDPDGGAVAQGEEGPFSLDPDESATFDLGDYPASKSGVYQLEATVEQYNVEVSSAGNLFNVESPDVYSWIEAPNVVDDEPFDVRLNLGNSGPVPADFNVTLWQYAVLERETVDDFEENELYKPPTGWDVSGDEGPDAVVIDYSIGSGIQSTVLYTQTSAPATMSREIYVSPGFDTLSLLYQFEVWNPVPTDMAEDTLRIGVEVDGEEHVVCSYDNLDKTARIEDGILVSPVSLCLIDVSAWQGEVITLAIEVVDGGEGTWPDVLLDDVRLMSIADEGEILAQMPLGLNANAFYVEIEENQISQDVLIEAEYGGDYERVDSALVDYGIKVDIHAEANQYYPEGEVQIPYEILNLGSFALLDQGAFVLTNDSREIIDTTTVDYFLAPDGLEEGLLEFNLSPGLYTLSYSTRDVERELSFTVVPLEGAIALNGDPVYPEGWISVFSAISNIGMFSGSFPTQYTISCINSPEYPIIIDQFTTSPSIDIGSLWEFPIELYLETGYYRIVATGLWSSSTASAVVEFEIVSEIAASMDSVLLDHENGFHPLEVSLYNHGDKLFNGILEVKTDFWSETRSVAIPLVGSNENFLINLEGVSPGIYLADVNLFDSSGIVIDTDQHPFEITGPNLIISSLPGYTVFEVGGQGILTYAVYNAGDQIGSGKFSLEALEDRFSRNVSLGPGDSIAMDFIFTIPDDVEENTYYGKYNLSGDDATASKGLSPFGVRGIKVNVLASQDARLYCIDENMKLALEVINTGSFTGAELNAVISYDGVIQELPFILPEDQVVLEFEVPITSFDVPHVVYSIETTSGRALYINSMCKHESGLSSKTV